MLRKFDMNTLQICPPHLSDVATLPWEIQKSFFNIIVHILQSNYITLHYVGAFLQATSRVPRWWIGERPPDMAASCDIYK